MVSRNSTFNSLKANYLFPEIQARVQRYLNETNDPKSLLSLGIGDTTEPIPHSIAQALAKRSLELGTPQGYTGYGKAQGNLELREAISKEIYKAAIDPDDIFISDGIKSEIGRIHQLFGPKATIAIPDPSYPVYAETSIIQGQTFTYLETSRAKHFFPSFENISSSLIYLCSPNNPTGTVATKEQLQMLLDAAKSQKSIILFDAAYAAFIQDSKLPKSIYELDRAKNHAIEMGSFSKMAGFTGVRLGWTVVPKELCFADGSSIKADWKRLHSTLFNGASNIAEAGGIAALSKEGKKEIRDLIHFYLENTKLLYDAVKTLPIEVFGGIHAPYLWLRFSQGSSWDIFERLLRTSGIICTPGSGFGPSGEGFVRLSAFGSRDTIIEAAKRLRNFSP